MILNPSNQEFDIIILAGQSNAESSGVGDSDTPWVINPNIFMLKGDYDASVEKTEYGNEFMDIKPSTQYRIEQADERVYNGIKLAVLALPFALKYFINDLKPERKILIIHTAVGGTGFANRHWGKGDVLYNRLVSMTEDALKMNPNNRIVAMLWHQGEHDAFERADLKPEERKNLHIKNLNELLDGLTEKFGEFPFISAGFTKAWYDKYLEQNRAILDAIKEVCSKRKNARFIENTFDLKNNDDVCGDGDEVHFCRQSIDILGERYYEKFKEIINEK